MRHKQKFTTLSYESTPWQAIDNAGPVPSGYVIVDKRATMLPRGWLGRLNDWLTGTPPCWEVVFTIRHRRHTPFRMDHNMRVWRECIE